MVGTVLSRRTLKEADSLDCISTGTVFTVAQNLLHLTHMGTALDHYGWVQMILRFCLGQEFTADLFAAILQSNGHLLLTGTAWGISASANSADVMFELVASIAVRVLGGGSPRSGRAGTECTTEVPTDVPVYQYQYCTP